MAYRALVVAILAAHFGFLGYVVAGGFLAWRRPAACWPHLAACAWAVLVVLRPTTCPLTAAEDWARQRAGQPPLTSGFIDRYVEGVLYPARYTAAVRALAALVVLVSWVGAGVVTARRRGSRRAPGG